MKSVSILTHLVTVLTATMLTVCPVASPGADAASDANRETGTEAGIAVQCQLPPKAAPAVRGGADSDPEAGGSALLSETEGDVWQSSEQSDLSGELLENLVKNDSN